MQFYPHINAIRFHKTSNKTSIYNYCQIYNKYICITPQQTHKFISQINKSLLFKLHITRARTFAISIIKSLTNETTVIQLSHICSYITVNFDCWLCACKFICIIDFNASAYNDNLRWDLSDFLHDRDAYV